MAAKKRTLIHRAEERGNSEKKMMRYDNYNNHDFRSEATNHKLFHNNHDFRSEATNHKFFHSCVLPSDIIIYHILTRVPTESLIRLRGVCKHWYYLILFDPLFIDLHSRLSYKPPRLIFDHCGPNISQLVFFDLNSMKEKNFKFPPPNYLAARNYKFKRIMCSFNGFLIISCLNRTKNMLEYVVCNPIMGRFTTLPELVLFKKQSAIFCLTYDSITSKYKVVCFIRDVTDASTGIRFYCKIFTVGDGERWDSWRDVALPKPHNYRFVWEPSHSPVFVNGSIYLIMLRNFLDRNDFEPRLQTLLSLDVSTETFDIIKNPKCNDPDVCCTLLEMGGKLCFVEHVSGIQLKLWVLKEEGLVSNHNKKHEWAVAGIVDIGFLVKEEEKRLARSISFRLNSRPFAIVKPNIMFWERNDIEGFVKYHSYDMELKQLNIICEQSSDHLLRPPYWHVSSIAYF